jgi:hypothetical protein
MKSKSTWVDGLMQHCVGGKIFTTWDQIGAATGRLTSVSPNLQVWWMGFYCIEVVKHAFYKLKTPVFLLSNNTNK